MMEKDLGHSMDGIPKEFKLLYAPKVNFSWKNKVKAVLFFLVASGLVFLMEAGMLSTSYKASYEIFMSVLILGPYLVIAYYVVRYEFLIDFMPYAIFDKGIKINDKLLRWKEVDHITIQTGRPSVIEFINMLQYHNVFSFKAGDKTYSFQAEKDEDFLKIMTILGHIQDINGKVAKAESDYRKDIDKRKTTAKRDLVLVLFLISLVVLYMIFLYLSG